MGWMMGSLRSRLALVLVTLILSLAPRLQAAAARYAPIRLPADAAMHPNAPIEWWYFVGHLRDGAGRTYGFELVNFKFSHLRQVLPAAPVDTLYRIDLAITDEGAGAFYSLVDYLAPAAPGVALATGTLSSRMPGPDGSLAISTLAGPGLAYHLQGRLPAGAIDLRVRSTRPPLLEGGSGVVSMGVGGYSYYYSLTNLKTSGTLTVKGARFTVSGEAWMDHQWGRWDWKTVHGWDWMALQLDNGTSICLYQFVGGHGGGAKQATISFPNGSQRATRDASMTPLAPSWSSRASGNVYPLAWRVRVPSLKLDVVVRATVPGQEMVDRFFSSGAYWEGSGLARGSLGGKSIAGLAYTELAGYGQESFGL
jgi:predicted secreted hydrolase